MGKCYDPTLCYTTPDGKRFIRSFSMASPIVKAGAQQVWDCNKCLHCRKKNAYELAMRCTLHASLYTHNAFLTLTKDEKKPEYKNKYDLREIQLFKKSLRSHIWRSQKARLDLFHVHEHGKNGKSHWHLIAFNLDLPDKKIYTYKNGIPLYTSQTLEEIWGKGFVTVGDVTEASAMYQSQYMEKDYKNGNADSDKKSKSQHRGIGNPYFLKHYKQLLQLGYVPLSGTKLPLPRTFERAAHKHYCHFYDKTAFFKTDKRENPLYTPFKIGYENKEIADLYIHYNNNKQEKIAELEKNWNEFITDHLINNTTPDFKNAGENAMYDLAKKNLKHEEF